VRRALAVVGTVAVGLALAGCGGGGGDGSSGAPATGAAQGGPTGSPYVPQVDPARFGDTVDNPYLPLRPGMRWVYRSETDEGSEEIVVEVRDQTRQVMGVTCVVVRDTVTVDGAVVEDTVDWFAQDRDGTVWYFGEDTKDYEDGEVVSTEGSWEAGVDGAQPGVVMPARPRVGELYRQEYYPGEAEDMAQTLSLTERIEVPTGAYDQVLMTKELTPLEPGVLEQKYYAAGVGLILVVHIRGGTGVEELVEFTG
jgi:uncharacterized protein YuzE